MAHGLRIVSKTPGSGRNMRSDIVTQGPIPCTVYSRLLSLARRIASGLDRVAGTHGSLRLYYNNKIHISLQSSLVNMTEDRFASTHFACADYTEEPAFRRSISIFSRRGTETPEPTPTFITQAAMRIPCPRSKPVSEKRKSWLGRRRSIGKKDGAGKKLSKGTVLHAVPHAKTIEMTALEEEMATSPNEEILSAISEHASTLRALTGTDSQSSSPCLPMRPRSNSTTNLTQRTMSQRRRDTSSRIGVWIDGVVQWDERALDDFLSPDAAEIEHTGFTPVRPVSSSCPRNSRKLPLSVVIPPHAPDRSVLTIVQPKPRRPVVSVAPPSIVSRYPTSTPTIVLDETMSAPSPPERPSAPSSSHKSHASISTTSSRVITDEESVYSRRSSATSVSLCSASEKKFRLSTSKLSLPSPASAGVFEETSSENANLNKSLPPTPAPTPPVRAAPSSSPAASTRQYNSLRVPGSERLQPTQPLRECRSMSELDRCDEEFMRSYVARRHAQTPTLSQAEQDVRAQLSTMEEKITPPQSSNESASATLTRRDSVRDVMQPPTRAPTIPKRSRKRDWRSSRHSSAARATMDFSTADVPCRRRSESHAKSNQPPAVAMENVALRKVYSVHHSKRSQDLLVLPQLEVQESLQDKLTDADVGEQNEDVSAGPSPICEEGVDTAAVSSASAEEVLLGILSSLASTDDLFNTAIINKGMYRVYKQNEMFLLRTVMANQSPAAWELREWSPPECNEVASSEASSQLEYDPLSYMRCFRRDLGVIERLKRLIMEHCQSFIRRETTFALSTPTHPNAQRFNDSFWRIWCFCEIFGGKKGREEDITGQLDWLKGGLLANNRGFSATVNTNLDFEMSSVLLNAPDHFARANPHGLAASQLFDMTEIWTCFAVLLQGYSGRIMQARDFGVFDNCDLVEGDIEAEEAMLEEWISYLLTLGPSVVLDMALLASDTTPSGFAYAKQQGWTNWTPPVFNGSRSNFLKEPVARSYEEQVAAAKLRLRDPIEQEQKEMSRKRVASMAAEIRLRRQGSDYRRLPFIDMKHERAMSTASRHSTVSSLSSRSTIRSSSSSNNKKTSARARRTSAPQASSNSAKALWQAPRPISPIIEDRVESFHRMSLINYAQGQAEDTSELAVQTIVAMGFPPRKAREALRQTDMGDGLRVDRAVEFLLRQN
ncbi:hypothetical protein AC578_2073 [Pseudocercospora eumusae]|uniref:UBA domain-containing protein n=1 Tax=Pseudocercospora eumusae TaxID=321146 RepID=A0A139HQF1_9PEZI|nr:hypothetical protein AC578_2073 [Pseudocercospora eumusae]